MLYASDHPWVEPVVITDCLDRAGLSAEELTKIYSLNARRADPAPGT